MEHGPSSQAIREPEKFRVVIPTEGAHREQRFTVCEPTPTL